MGLGAALLLLFNLPDGTARGLKAAVRELLAPYHGAVASLGGWRIRQSAPSEADADAGSPAATGRSLLVLERENAELRRLLALRPRGPRRWVAAQVIARDGEAGWWRTIRLDRGTRDGIAIHDVVVAPEGLVGTVRAVSPHTADVLLVSDPGCRIAVRGVRTADCGLLAGGGAVGRPDGMALLASAASAMMTYLPPESGIQPGDEVATSGLGGVFPEGYRVGTVESVQPARSGLYLEARVVLAADLARLHLVWVGAQSLGPRRDGEAPP